MRYEKVDNLMVLALEMQAARGGLSLKDIGERFDVGRRTAMRMRDAVLRIFPQAEEVSTYDRTKRWRIPAGTLDKLIGCSADELGDLETAISILKRENMLDQASSLVNLKAKLTALMAPDVTRRVEPDLEALLEAENLALRPGPKPRTRPFVLSELRDAVKACRVCTLRQRTRATGKISQRTVFPYGFLYGQRHYLVAYVPRASGRKFRMFSLPNIVSVKATKEFFERDPSFTLENFAQNSFGVYQEQPVDVAWKFSPRAANDAKDFIFHPNQELEKLKDGSLIVRFHAGGLLEMCWHVYCWGDQIEVLEPRELEDMCANIRKNWPGLP
jgi:predicted DNA-binding transcriptional regulator YafY